MIVFLLLVIIAILLFGSSAFIGAVGAVLGFMALVLALFFGFRWVSSSFGLTLDDVFLPAVLGFAGLFCLAWLILWVLVERQKHRR